MEIGKQPHPEVRNSESGERGFRVRYFVLTLGIFLPLILSFLFVRNLYPSTAWTVMMSGGSLERQWTYCIVRGETTSGAIVDIRPPKLVDGLYGRTWSMVNASINNDAVKLPSPHPENARLIAAMGGVENVPRGVRVPTLLKSLGQLYNEQLPADSPERIKAVRVDVYRWDSGRFEHYDRFVETWRQEL